jgi:hypothetical protein
LYCGASQEGVVNPNEGAEAEVKSEDAASVSMDDVPWQLAMEKTKRRKPLGIATQIIIFFAAFALMGLVVLLLS